MSLESLGVVENIAGLWPPGVVVVNCDPRGAGWELANSDDSRATRSRLPR
jgi:hypothetical protein